MRPITTYIILVCISFTFINTLHSQKKYSNKKKTTVEVYYGIGTSSDIRKLGYFGRENLRRTLKQSYGFRFYTSAGNRFNIGFGVSAVSKGYNFDSDRYNKNGTFNGIPVTYTAFEDVVIHRTYWYLGTPLIANFQITKPKKNSKYDFYYEFGVIPSLFIYNVDKVTGEFGRQIEREKSSWTNQFTLISTASFVFSYNLSRNLSVILRPTFRYEFRIYNYNTTLKPYNELNFEVGIRQRLYKWWGR